MFSRPMVSEGWLQATASLLHQWVVRNKQRPVTDHPAFDQVVVRPINGSPGIYLFRAPPVPFSPLLSADVYTFRPAAMIFETMEEFHEIEEYLQTPGACFFHQAPLFRVNPPSRDRPAVMPGGIREGAIHIIGTPWEGARAFSVYAVPDVVLEGRSSKIRAGLYRGRYATHTAADRFAADRYFRSVFGERMEISATIALGSLHPRAGGDQIGGHAGGLAGL
jgi:hypothetical protein